MNSSQAYAARSAVTEVQSAIDTAFDGGQIPPKLYKDAYILLVELRSLFGRVAASLAAIEDIRSNMDKAKERQYDCHG